MGPNRTPQTTLVDLLDRILDKGLMLDTDLIITVAGIPLIGINLKLALAGMETMLEYGIMKDWDEAQRAVAMKETDIKKPTLGKDEHIIFSVFGSHWYSKGIYNNWRAGTIYITNKRLLLFRKLPFEILLDVYYEQMGAMAIQEKQHFTGKREELSIMLKDDEAITLHTKDVRALKKVMEDIISKKGLTLEEDAVVPVEEKDAVDFLQPEEIITHRGTMWYRFSYIMDGTTHYQWKPGHLYLTNQRLCWWYDFDKKLLFEIPAGKIMHAAVQDVQFGSAPVAEKSMVILYKDEKETQAVCFSEKEESLRDWEKVFGELIEENEKEGIKNMEPCPVCGRLADRESLLTNGCLRCGWMSHREKK